MMETRDQHTTPGFGGHLVSATPVVLEHESTTGVHQQVCLVFWQNVRLLKFEFYIIFHVSQNSSLFKKMFYQLYKNVKTIV